MPQPSTIDLTRGSPPAAASKTRRRLRHAVPIERHHVLESAAESVDPKPSLAWRLLQSFASRTDQD